VNEIIRVFPKLVPIPAAEWLTKLGTVITLETNRTDWTRLVELVALIGGNPENSTQEANAIVRLVVGFDDLSARVGAELHPALHEAEEIVRRVWDRSGEAVHAGQLVVKGRSVLNLTVLVTIPPIGFGRRCCALLGWRSRAGTMLMCRSNRQNRRKPFTRRSVQRSRKSSSSTKWLQALSQGAPQSNKRCARRPGTS
jgi:hypothetical protein